MALPTDWSPDATRTVAEGTCRDAMQVSGDAICLWHPDGERILLLDANEAGKQSVVAVHRDTGEKTLVSPVRAASLAFSVSPDG